jgi:GT2 family glycosyltransferase
MSMNPADPYPAKNAGLGLWFALHFDAFRAAPRAYLTAFWWRLRGKRLRSRGQFARLLGDTRRAYEMWVLRKELSLTATADDAKAQLLALVDVRSGQGGLDETLRNLAAEAVPALLIGTSELPTIADAIGRIEWSEKLWLMPIASGDRLARGAGMAYRAAIAGSKMRIAYADDDLLDQTGRRTAPHFKPDWNSELFEHFDYLTGACALQATPEDLQSLAGADDWARKLVTRLAGDGGALHIRKVLHHRRMRPRPQLPAAPILPTRELPLVSIIIPTRNRVDLLRTCLNGIADTDYPNIEVIVVDNDSDDPETLAYLAGLDPVRHRVLRHEGAFNYSEINNRAVREARGQLLCLLNNDIEVIEPSWLSTMVVQALRDNVGAVGARLLYPDGRIQHAGVVIGVGGAAGHAHRLVASDTEGYFHRHALPQFASAVTAACLVVARERFLAAGGLDERNFAVAFNDVDLCMRLNQQGWQSLYEPRATLIHHESVSRGLDRDLVGAARFAGELAALQRLWHTDEVVDPFHHPELSRVSERFVVGL